MSHAALESMPLREVRALLRAHDISTAACIEKEDIVALAKRSFEDTA